MSLFGYIKVPRFRAKVALTPTASNAGWKVANVNAGTRFGEVLVAIKGLTAKNAVAVPTFVMTQTSTVHYVTAGVLTLIVTASKAVNCTGAATIALTIGAFTRQAVFNATTSTSTVLRFDYTFVAADVAASSIPIAGAIKPEPGTGITMVIDANSSERLADAVLTFTPLAASNVTVN